MFFKDYAGIDILVNHITHKIKRTWKERLFTRPWKPLKKFNEVPLIDDGVFVMFGPNKAFVNPRTFAEIKRIDFDKYIEV